MRIIEPAVRVLPSRVALVRHECGALLEITESDIGAAGYAACEACSLPPWIPAKKLVWSSATDERTTVVTIDEDTEAAEQGRGVRAKIAAAETRVAAEIAEVEIAEVRR